jgi:AraC-like DNA-binding protein
MVVRQEFEKAGIKPVEVKLGEVDLENRLSDTAFNLINARLQELGFEILDDQKQQLIEKIKKLLIEMIQSGQVEEHLVVSGFLTKKLNKEYSQLSRLFSEVEGITIEQFYILQKIEKVKEWMSYDELTLSEIAWKLGYSSVAHLSSQFKKITGLTPSEFRKLSSRSRKPIDEI